MIKKISIKNFKSLLNLELDCKKINLFIGEPNTGKSNILEALGVLSWSAFKNTPLNSYVRLHSTQNIFYDDLIDRIVQLSIVSNETEQSMKIKYKNDEFHFFGENKEGIEEQMYVLDYSGKITKEYRVAHNFNLIKFYRFLRQEKFPAREATYLIPPHGSNMFSIVMSNQKYREILADFFKTFNFNLVLKPQVREFEVQKQVNDVVISYPYALISDTLQRIIFHVLAIDSNDNSALIFEEPESHAFPYYTKFLGEKIAYDESNQYFIATHNPYFLLSILEKAEKNSVNVFITYFKDYQTKVKPLTDDQISELMDYDPFFNLNSFIDEE